MRAAQIDENNAVLQVLEVDDLGFLPDLVADPDAVAGQGDTYDADNGKFIKPATELPPGETFEDMKRRLAKLVDDTIAAVYNRWTRFQPEYAAREVAARDFVANLYAGTPSVWITSFAIPAGLTVRDAADRIIAQADALSAGLQALGACRMAKYGIQGAEDTAAAQRVYDDIIQGVKEIERNLP